MGEHPYFLINQTLSQFVLDKALVRGNVLFKIDFVILFKLTKLVKKNQRISSDHHDLLGIRDPLLLILSIQTSGVSASRECFAVKEG